MEFEPPATESPSNSWQSDQPIVIDFGSYNARFGMASASNPAHSFPSVSSKARDKTVTVGAPALVTNARNTLKFAHENGVVVSWDVVEHTFDFGFNLMGVSSEGCVDSPLVLSEQLAGPHSVRKTMAELLFEAYGVPKLATAVDALAAFPRDTAGIGVHLGHEAAYVTPFSPNANLSSTRRLNWGGRSASEFMQNLLVLKYPHFPAPLAPGQAGQIFRKACYVSQDYRSELRQYMDIDYLASHEFIVQQPVKAATKGTDPAVLAERKQQSAEKLKQQTAERQAKRREEKIQRLAQLEDLLQDGELEQFESEEHLEAAILALKRSLYPDQYPEEDVPPDTPLLQMPDAQLTGEQLQEKRRQRMLRTNYDNKIRLRAEKQARADAAAKAAAEDEEWRQRDLQGWIKTKREQLWKVHNNIKDQRKLKAQLSDRRSLASKMRMKEIVMLASGESPKKRKLDEDNFGADDADWSVYQQEDEENEAADEDIKEELMQQLLKYDENFTEDELLERRDWRASVLHKFEFGAHPLDETPEQAWQLNINVERIRVPEVLFQPHINGVDQAGLGEIVLGVLKAQQQPANIYLSGGLAHLPGLADRLKSELRAGLPESSDIKVETASDPSNAAWRGMAAWAQSPEATFTTRADYDEHGWRGGNHLFSNAF